MFQNQCTAGLSGLRNWPMTGGRVHLLYLKRMTKVNVLLYSTGNSAQ